MNKLLLSSLVFIGLIANVEAATISGVVVDQKTGAVIPDAKLHLMRKDGDNYSTGYSARSDVNGEFVFLNKSIGTYALKIEAVGYQREYYNDALVWEDRTDFTLSKQETIRLDLIDLRPYKYAILSAIPSTEELFSAGGDVIFDVQILNKTNRARTVKLWGIAQAKDIHTGFSTAYPMEKTPRKVVLQPNQVTTAKLTLKIPPKHVAGGIHTQIYIGQSYGKPLSHSAYSYVYKDYPGASKEE